jgi:D(-)-tartrate dehydratase
MRIVDIIERTIPISRYSDPRIPSDGLNTTVVAIITDVHRNGRPIVGFGFSSIGRFGQVFSVVEIVFVLWTSAG